MPLIFCVTCRFETRAIALTDPKSHRYNVCRRCRTRYATCNVRREYRQRTKYERLSGQLDLFGASVACASSEAAGT